MNTALTLLTATLCAPPPAPAAPDTKFAQLAPVYREGPVWQPSVAQPRAVVLVHGLHIHPFSSRNVKRAEWRNWQRPDSPLVKALALEADVFGFAYSQDVPLETIAETPGLHNGIQRLRGLGYREVVLLGHSAGGLVARQFVEDHPGAGVTKVIQVCAPNGGSNWARARMAVRKNQGSFLSSLTRKDRQHSLEERAGKGIPAGVEFVCVVGRVHIPVLSPREKGDRSARGWLRPGDGVVSAASQWTPELQEQGIPAVPLSAGHSGVLHSKDGIEAVVRLVRERIRRWDADTVRAARRRILGDEQK
jgi:pimeloyl-ACP methyl ester carboxylesterase